MDFQLNDRDYDLLIDKIFIDFISLKNNSNNFNKKSSETVDTKEVDDDIGTEETVLVDKNQTHNTSRYIDDLGSTYLDKIFYNNELIQEFQKKIIIYFNKLVIRYKMYINERNVGKLLESDIIKERKILDDLKLEPLQDNDILFIWKGSTVMKTIYNKYKDILDPSVKDKYGKFFSKKSDADCALFINPHHKDAEYHRDNLIKLFFLSLCWLRDSINMTEIDKIMENIKFDIDYKSLRGSSILYTGPLKDIQSQEWKINTRISKDKIFIPIKTDDKSKNKEYIFPGVELKNETFTEGTTYYQNKNNKFYISIHQNTQISNGMCNDFKKDFSLIKLKTDLIIKGDITYNDGEKQTVSYLLKNDIIDIAFRTIDDKSLIEDYKDIKSIVKSYKKLLKKPKIMFDFSFNSYTLDGFIMDFIYNLFKTPFVIGKAETGEKKYECYPWHVEKYKNNINRIFYFILLKLIFIKKNDKANILQNIIKLLYNTIDINIEKEETTDDKVLKFLTESMTQLKIKTKTVSESDYNKKNFFNILKENLDFIISVLNKQNISYSLDDDNIYQLKKYLKYKEKYLKLKNIIGGAYTPSFPHFSLFIKSDINDSELVEFLTSKTNALVADSSKCCYVPNHSIDYKYHISLVRLYINVSHPNYKIISNTNWTIVQNLIKTAVTNYMNSMQISLGELNTIGINKSFIAVYFKSNKDKTNYDNFIKDIVNIFSNDNSLVEIFIRDKLINVFVNHNLFACFEDYYYEPNHITIAQSDDTKEHLQTLSLLVKQYNLKEMCKYIVKKYNMNTNTSNVMIKSANAKGQPSEILNKNNYK